MSSLLLPEAARLIHVGPQKTGTTAVEVQVRVLLGAVETRQLDLSLEDSARPRVLDASEVSDQAGPAKVIR